MPFTSKSTTTPLSQNWTYEQVASEAMVITNTIDNERLQLSNIRTHLNANLSYLAELLNLASEPWYGLWLSGELETTLHVSGLEWINLATAVTGFVPANGVSAIKRITLSQNATPATTDWVDNTTRQDISQLGHLNSGLNIQWKDSIAWNHHGSELLFFVGANIITVANGRTNKSYNISTQPVTAWGYRYPVLDALLSPNDTSANNNYRTKVDLPDKYINLLIKMTQQKMLEQLNLQVPAQIEQNIAMGIAQINNGITQEKQFEQQEREKRRYGMPQQPPGVE